MKAPCHGRGVKKCCCCCTLDPDYVCYLIGALCIAFMAFGGPLAGIGSWIEIIVAVIGFFYYTIAGLCLLIGTLYMNRNAKIFYCWMMFFGIILILAAVILAAVGITSGKRDYFFLPKNEDEFVTAIYIAFIVRSVFLIFFSIYTPLLVLGNMDTYRVAFYELCAALEKPIKLISLPLITTPSYLKSFRYCIHPARFTGFVYRAKYKPFGDSENFVRDISAPQANVQTVNPRGPGEQMN